MSAEYPANEWEATGDILLYTHRNAELIKSWRAERELKKLQAGDRMGQTAVHVSGAVTYEELIASGRY